MKSITGLVSSSFITTHAYSGTHSCRKDLLKHEAVVVLDEETKEFVGVLTARDVIERPHNLIIDCLSQKPGIYADCSVEIALEIMFSYNTNVLPVLASTGKLEGLVFKNDLLKALWQRKQELNNALSEEKNITQQQHESIKISEKILTAVYDSSREMQFLAAPDYAILFFNKAAFDHALRHNGRALVNGDNLKDFIKTFFEKIDIGLELNFKKALAGEYIVSEAQSIGNAYKRWVRTEYHPVFVNNSLAGVSVIIKDITSEKENEVYIQKQNKLLREIAFAQSHLIRQPLTNILALVELMDKDHMSKENKEMVEFLQISANNLDCAIREIVQKASVAFAS